MNQITGASIQPSLPVQLSQRMGAESGAGSFKNLLLESLQQVNAMQVNADKAVEQLFAGGDANPAEVLTAVQKADMSFKLMMQIRNKLVQALQEVKEIRI